MFHFSLLAVSENATDVVSYVSLGIIALCAVILAIACIKSSKFTTRSIAYAGVCLAASFTLSFIKISPVQYGGSITLASFVPLLIYTYAYGPIKGLFVGTLFGLLNFVSNPYILTPMTFVLDYILAFASISLMGFAKKLGNLSTCSKVLLGTLFVYVARFTFHLISGFIYFAEDAIWVDLPTTNAFVYSLIYQSVYVPADFAICAIVLAVLSKTKTLDRLLAVGRKD